MLRSNEDDGPCDLCMEQHNIWTAEAVELITLLSGEQPDSDLKIDLMAALKIEIEELIRERDELKGLQKSINKAFEEVLVEHVAASELRDLYRLLSKKP